MASLLCPTPSTLRHNPRSACFSALKLASPTNLCLFTNRYKSNPARCNALLGNVLEDLLENTLHLDQFPVFRYGFLQFQRFTGELPEMEKWGFLVFAGLTWIYLTARPGVLLGAIDAYLLAPLQLGLDGLTGKRNLKTSDFVIGRKLGEGSFGIVYSGAIVPKNVAAETKVQKRGRKNALELDDRVKEKVILKKVISVMAHGIILFFFWIYIWLQIEVFKYICLICL
jgi:hypothetical protein